MTMLIYVTTGQRPFGAWPISARRQLPTTVHSSIGDVIENRARHRSSSSLTTVEKTMASLILSCGAFIPHWYWFESRIYDKLKCTRHGQKDFLHLYFTFYNKIFRVDQPLF